ncbi:MAG TPA: hypothetical protein VFE22_03605, partial [Edaphobacter sp.]|nr:hypothetical protein [Edaphobacter sp.]
IDAVGLCPQRHIESHSAFTVMSGYEIIRHLPGNRISTAAANWTIGTVGSNLTCRKNAASPGAADTRRRRSFRSPAARPISRPIEPSRAS